MFVYICEDVIRWRTCYVYNDQYNDQIFKFWAHSIEVFRYM